MTASRRYLRPRRIIHHCLSPLTTAFDTGPGPVTIDGCIRTLPQTMRGVTAGMSAEQTRPKDHQNAAGGF